MLSPMTSGSTRLTVRRRSSRRSCTNHNRWSCGRDRERAGALPRSSLQLGPVSSVLQHLGQPVVNGVITGTILALTGVGLTLVFGIHRIANFAHGEYLTFGAYIGLFANTGLGFNVFLSASAAIVATAGLAVALHFAVLRPLAGRGLVATSLVTVGLGLMVRDVIFLIAGPRIRELAIDQTAVLDLGIVRISPGQAIA